jgi:hypothetical protein
VIGWTRKPILSEQEAAEKTEGEPNALDPGDKTSFRLPEANTFSPLSLFAPVELDCNVRAEPSVDGYGKRFGGIARLYSGSNWSNFVPRPAQASAAAPGAA